MMVAGIAAKPAKKSTYRPHIRKVSDTEYTCQSERYTYVLYLVQVRPDGSTCCDCDAGSFGRNCKHQRSVVAYLAYRANPLHLRPAQPPTPSAAPMVAFRPVPAEMAWA